MGTPHFAALATTEYSSQPGSFRQQVPAQGECSSEVEMGPSRPLSTRKSRMNRSVSSSTCAGNSTS